MKTIVIVLLLAAIGGGAYYFFVVKKQNSPASSQVDLIKGKWRIDSLHAGNKDSTSGLALLLASIDSNLHRYEFEFKNDSIVQSLDGKTETVSRYQLADKKLLLWSGTDTVKQSWKINKLDSVNLVVQNNDSSVFVFKKNY